MLGVKPNSQVQTVSTWEQPKMTVCVQIISRIRNSVISRCNPEIMAPAECSQISSEISETIPGDLRHIRTVLATCKPEGRRAICCLSVKNLLPVKVLCFIYSCALSLASAPPTSNFHRTVQHFPQNVLFEHLNCNIIRIFFYLDLSPRI